MRNGLNVSGISELVHEITEKPAEAFIKYNTHGRWVNGKSNVEVQTAHQGTIRIARGFVLDLSAIADPADDSMTPYESALTAVGACVLITHVFGYTTRGMSLSNLAVSVYGEVSVPCDGAAKIVGIEKLRYDIDIDIDGMADDATMKQVSQFVTCFSPNHRVLVDAVDYQATVLVRRSDGATESFTIESNEIGTVSGGRQEPSEQKVLVESRLQWQYGTQTTVTTSYGVGADLRVLNPALVVDQPKQLVGIDKGPNPQELLLAAISGDVLAQIRTAFIVGGMPEVSPTIHGTGWLDMRGVLNVSSSSLARFDGLQFEISIESDLPIDIVRRSTVHALSASAVLQTLRAEQSIQVTLNQRGEPFFQFDASVEQADKFLALFATHN